MTEHDVDNLPPNSIAARDREDARPKSESFEGWPQRAALESGRPMGQILKEVNQASRWPGQLSGHEYLSYRLYEMDKAERKQFISEWIHWPLCDACNDPEWADKSVDKWQCTSILSDNDVDIIPISAMVDPSDTNYGETTHVSNTDELSEFLSAAELPLFAKPNNLLGSVGAFRIDAFDGEQITLHDGSTVPIDSMVDEFMSGIPYLLQPAMRNHDSIAEFAQGLATLRVVSLVDNDAVSMPFMALKIPVGDHVADNLWRPGNLLANVDPETGIIDRVVLGSGPDLEEFENHPDTGTPLVGMQLPDWEEMLAVSTRAARVFGALPYQSHDMAFTNHGPVIVELNSGGAFALPQIASGRGMLTPEIKKFFESHGVNFRKLPNPRLEAA